MDEDYYKLLGIGRSATAAEIQKAYRSLARKYHPDVNPDDKAAKSKFQQIQKAYEVLNDPEKREMYDRYGSSFESLGAGGPGRTAWRTSSGGPGGFQEIDLSELFGGQPAGGQQGSGAFGDFFRHFTGSGRTADQQSRRRPPRGANMRHELEIPFTTSITGGEVRINVQRPNGKVESITVKIPSGIEDGKTIRLRGQGEPGSARQQSGDLLIKIRVTPHRYFRRQGNNLEVSVPVTVAEAALGASVDVPSPQGTITVKVPRGTSSGNRLRVRGHGVKPAGGAAGDLLAEIQIVLPESTDPQSEKLIRELDQRQALSPRKDLRW